LAVQEGWNEGNPSRKPRIDNERAFCGSADSEDGSALTAREDTLCGLRTDARLVEQGREIAQIGKEGSGHCGEYGLSLDLFELWSGVSRW
jgi:hypothetical protein